MKTNLSTCKKIKYYSTTDFINLFEKFINDSVNGKRIKKDGRRIKLSTINSYVGAHRILKYYVSDTSNELRIYLQSNLTKRDKDQASKFYKKFYLSFTNYMYFRRNLFDNYVKLIVKIIKTFFNYLKSELLLDVGNYHDNFYTITEETDIIVLRPEQLNYLIYDEALNQNIPEKLIWVKDIFVFGCTVALRFSDMINLKSKNLYYVNDACYLKVVSGKTSTPTSIKLPDYAIDIIKKYQHQQDTLFPKCTLSWFNTNLKELAQYLKYDEPIKKYRSKRGIKYEIFKDEKKKIPFVLADHITTHTMRRTAISTLLSLGMPEQAVRKISGHAANSREFFRYVEFAQNYLDEHSDKVFNKLKKLNSVKSRVKK